MSDRYFAKVVSILDKYTVVINAGADKEVRIGTRFLIVGLGEIIYDPDSGEELEQLEIVRGNAQVTHVQGKIATLRSSEYEKTADKREVKKVTARGSLSVFGGDTVTETTKPGEQILKELNGAQIGDRVIVT